MKFLELINPDNSYQVSIKGTDESGKEITIGFKKGSSYIGGYHFDVITEICCGDKIFFRPKITYQGALSIFEYEPFGV